MTSTVSTVGRTVRTAALTPVAAARRATAGPVLIRLIAVVAAVAAAAFAAPSDLLLGPRLPSFVIVGGLCAIGVGLFPRARWVGVYLLGVVGLWLVSTIAYAVPAGLVRIGGLAACLYLTHAAASFAAVLPYDTLVPGRVLRRWAGRVGTVLVAGVGLAVGGMALVDLFSEVSSAVGTIVGSLIAAALAGLLAWHVRKRS
jgi:hypothetical protein